MSSSVDSPSASGTRAVAPQTPALDQGAAVKMLAGSLGELRDRADLMGLIRVQGLALALADASTGRARRRAVRLANRAASVAQELRRSGVETPEERSVREAREEREARWNARDARNKLSERVVAVLHLLLGDGSTPDEETAVLRELLIPGEEGFLRVEFPGVFESWAPALVDGYEQILQFFLASDSGDLRLHRDEIERKLKAVAVELLAAGAEVRGLSADLVPLIAYGLYNGRLPVLPAAETAAASDKVDDLILARADEIAAMPARLRPLFVGLYRLAILLGEAQAYGDRVELRPLSLS